MSAAEVVYLYSRGDRRHIAEPGLVHPDDGKPVPYCNPMAKYDTDEEMAAEFRRFNDDARAQELAARKRNRPLCRRCDALANAPVTVRFYR